MPPNPSYSPAPAEFDGADDSRLLEATERTGSRYAEARRRLREHWAQTREDLSRFRRQATDYSQSAAKATDAYARSHPWRTAGAAVGLGALLGWLISRR